MRKIFFIVAIFATVFLQNSFAQDSTTQAQPQLSQLLTSYYNIKNALVTGNAGNASVNAEQFVKTANSIDGKVLGGNINALLKDAGKILEAKDIKKQREFFANFSTNMFALAKAVKLTTDSVYQAYCPMQKASWLSSDKAIRNPYYGSAMLTCGSIKEIL